MRCYHAAVWGLQGIVFKFSALEEVEWSGLPLVPIPRTIVDMMANKSIPTPMQGFKLVSSSEQVMSLFKLSAANVMFIPQAASRY
jgi:hypothetical protein